MTRRRSELFLDVASELLSRGHRVRFRAEGGSMHPTIRSGEAIIVEPAEPANLREGEIALHQSRRGITAHRVVEIREESEPARVFITRGDNADAADEPVESGQILGKVVAVERRGGRVDMTNRNTAIKSLIGTHRFGLRAWLRSRAAYRLLRGFPVLLLLLVAALDLGAPPAWEQNIGTPASIGVVQSTASSPLEPNYPGQSFHL